MSISRWYKPLVGSALAASIFQASAQTFHLTVDANANRKPISPLIYGVAFGTQAEIADLHCPLNRMGGNSQTRYNWSINADNKAADWYFESIGDSNATPGYRADSFIAGNKAAGADTMMTIPMIPWIAKLGANRANLDSFSVAKYGPQAATDPYWSDAGNGVSTTNGNPNITGNNPNDANTPNSPSFELNWIKHLVSTWGTAANGGLKYYLMDNEPSIWYSSHRDVHPVGPTMDEILYDIIDYAAEVKATDPGALVVGPEEWGWDGYLLSGYDQQYGALHAWNLHPDKDAHNGAVYVPYLLQRLNDYQQVHKQRLLDVLSLHYYPQDGSGNNGTDAASDAIRNRGTRSLWDPAYVDQSWINAVVDLIPKMKSWVSSYYPGTLTAITEYNWGAEGNINGATAQADVLGIFGWQGLDMATRWTCPDPSTPTYKAIKMYRNYDGLGSGFGDTSVSDTGSNPDVLSSFAAVRNSDGALTIMMINKVANSVTANLLVKNFSGNGTSQVWELTDTNSIGRLSDIRLQENYASVVLPAQSVTLFVLPPSGTPITKPGTPIGLTCYGLNQRVYLEWNNSPGAVSYTLWKSTRSTGGFSNIAGTVSSSFTDTKVSNGTTYYYKVYAINSAGASAATAPASATPSAGTVDSAEYNFEAGTQGWTSSGGLIGYLANSYAEAFAGQASLAVGISAAGNDSQTVSISAPSTPAGKTVTFHIWLPTGCQLSSIQPYVLQGASGGWSWTGNWQSVSNLKLGAWNTLTVQVPTNAVTPLYSLGVQFSSSAAWSGTCYIDSVRW